MAQSLTLATLPNELLDAICARLNRRSCCAVALTCKATKPSATAALYRTYTNRSSPSDAPFFPFLRAIFENAELATLVKEMDIRGWRSEHEVANGRAWRPMVTSLEEEDDQPTHTGLQYIPTERPSAALKKATLATSKKMFHLFLVTAVKIGLVAMSASSHLDPALKKKEGLGRTLKEDADLIRLLKHGVEDAHFILIVAQLPQLEKLLVDGLTPFPILDWHHFFSRSKMALQSVKILNLWCAPMPADNRVVKSTLQILNILPNLEYLRLASMSVQGHQHGSEDTLPSKKLKIVSFRECAVSHRLIKKIADGQHIESFLYVPGHPQLQHNKGATFSEELILGYLESSKRSLKCLIMFPMAECEQTRVRREFENLEILDLPFPGTIPWFDADDDLELVEDLLRERLPTSLKRLVLNRLLHVEHLAKIAEAIARLKLVGALPHLRSLVLIFCEPLAMYMMGISPLTVDEITARIESQVGAVFKEVKLKLKFRESA